MRFRFGAYTLDFDSRQLFRQDQAIHISPKAFELLKALVEDRPRALSKSELHERLWPGTFVSDANLAILIAEIRRAVNDDARNPLFVRTVHGFGYAFMGTAAELEGKRAEPAGTQVSYWLIWRRRKFALEGTENLAGRSPEATIWLDVPGVSREHARITIADGQATVEDLGSRNGTFVAGERVTGPVALRDGDRVQFGPVLMTFCVWTPGAGTRTQDLTERASPAS